MATRNRTSLEVTPLWLLGAVGGLFIALGVVQTSLRLGAGAALAAGLTDFFLVAGPGFALLYGTYRASGSSLDPSLYARIAGWSLGGIGLMLGVVWLLSFNPAGDLDQPLRAAVIGAGIGANGGFLVGTNEAQSIVRAHEAEERTQELARTNRELEETKAELEETVTRLERSNERLEQFAYAASHDLQEPLRMVSSYLRLVESRYQDALDDEGREFIEFAVDGADRMREMVDGLLQYSRVQSEGDPVGPVDLNAILEDARDDLRVRIDRSDAEITAEELPEVVGDESQLRQLFQNLVENAIKYSGDEPPRIRVSVESGVSRPTSEQRSAERVPADQPSDRGTRADGAPAENADEVTISVSDDGIGIDPDHHDRIFGMFKQLQGGEDQDGAGIGLPLCKRVVERHGGEMWIESTPGDGSTFYFTLPESGSQTSPVAEPEPAAR